MVSDRCLFFVVFLAHIVNICIKYDSPVVGSLATVTLYAIFHSDDDDRSQYWFLPTEVFTILPGDFNQCSFGSRHLMDDIDMFLEILGGFLTLFKVHHVAKTIIYYSCKSPCCSNRRNCRAQNRWCDSIVNRCFGWKKESVGIEIW